MVCVMLDGFDKYGVAPNFSNTVSVPNLLAQEWTQVSSQGAQIVAGLSATGYAIGNLTNGAGVTKNFPSNYTRLIGGLRFQIQTLSGGAANGPYIQFLDSATAQCSIRMTDSTMRIGLYNGLSNGTLIANIPNIISQGSIHYLEWDLTFSATGAYQIWLDGVSVLSGTGNLHTTTNNTANGISIAAPAGAVNTLVVDDFYLFDSTGTTNNTAVNTCPRVETVFPVSDNQAQFTFGLAAIGHTTPAFTTTGTSIGANGSYYQPITPAVNCTLNSVDITAQATSPTLQTQAFVYTNSAGGVPGTLLTNGAGTVVTGCTTGQVLSMPFATPPTLTAGTTYWIGFMASLTVSGFAVSYNNQTDARSATITFTSGPPSTAPTTTAIANLALWAQITPSTPVNYLENIPAPQLNTAFQQYVQSTTVTNEDLFNMGALTLASPTIYVCGTKVAMALSGAGTRTGSVHTKSGTTDVGATSVTPAISWLWESQYLGTDPNTGAAWTLAGANAAQAGYRLDT